MNTTTTKIAGEAMTDDQIIHLARLHRGNQDWEAFSHFSHIGLLTFARALLASKPAVPFQTRVQPWMLECFGAEIAADRIERNHRFFEEATEAVQANGMTRCEAHQLVDYTFDRPVGELHQEIGGVMVTLAALCLASGQDMHAAGETELARIWTKVEAIRAKQAAKPKHSPLPTAPAQPCGEDAAEQADEAATDAMVRRAILNEAADIAESMLLYTGLDIAQRLRDVAKNPFYLCDCISHEECKSLSGCRLKDKS